MIEKYFFFHTVTSFHFKYRGGGFIIEHVGYKREYAVSWNQVREIKFLV